MKDFSLLKVARKLVQKGYSLVAPASYAQVERAEWIHYINLLYEGMIVFDVGANIGEFTLLFSHFVGQRGQVHAFEPTPDTFARLQTITQSTNRSNLKLNQVALADKTGTVAMRLYEPEFATWNTLADRPIENYGLNVQPPTIEKVAAMTIDGYCAENQIDHIDLLKIDVEGAEYQVLLGAR